MDCLAGSVRHFDRKYEYRPNQWVHPSTLEKISKHLDSGEIQLRGTVSVGRNCHVERGVVIQNSHIGHTSLIERDVEIKDSLIMSFANIQHKVAISGAVMGRHSTIEEHSVVSADSSTGNDRLPVIGENVTLPAESVVGPGTRVAPLKHSHRILATGRFLELGTDDRNIYFTEKLY
jgi:NDP-sugar pyrophosphorylase family protein